MKIFKITDFDTEGLDNFNSFASNHWDDAWTIYLECVGGSNWIESHISFIINTKVKEQGNVTINVAQAYSSAFRMLIGFKGNVRIIPSARGMMHLSTMTMQLRSNGTDTSSNEGNFPQVLKTSLADSYKEGIEFSRAFMTSKELEDYKNGKDVFFTCKRMKQILKNNKINLVD